MSALIVDDPRRISALIEWQRAKGYSFRLPMYRAALAGEIRLLEVPPEGRAPQRYLKPGSPLLIVLGDDGETPTGPSRFPQARRLLAWAAAAMLYSTGGDELHYRAAVAATRTARRVLIIETGSARRDDWASLLHAENNRRDGSGRKLLPVVDIRVRPGAPAHPLETVA